MTFRIVVTAHGPLAPALVASAALIAGVNPRVTAVALPPGMAPDAFRDELAAAVEADDAPVLVLTDLNGGTPSNVARVICRRRPGTWLIANASLPLLLEAATAVSELDDDAADRLAAAAAPVVAERPGAGA